MVHNLAEKQLNQINFFEEIEQFKRKVYLDFREKFFAHENNKSIMIQSTLLPVCFAGKSLELLYLRKHTTQIDKNDDFRRNVYQYPYYLAGKIVYVYHPAHELTEEFEELLYKKEVTKCR